MTAQAHNGNARAAGPDTPRNDVANKDGTGHPPDSDTPTIASVLAAHAVRTPVSDIPPLALEHAKMSLASTIASASMGYRIPSAEIVRRLALEDGGAPQATLWFHGAPLPVAQAARVNAVASDAAASDDSDLRSIAHIGTIVGTTALAVAEWLNRPGRDLLAAMALGYEVAGRIDESLTPGRMQRGFHGSVSTVFGAAVAGGRLLGLDVAAMTHAIALAATSIGGMAVAADTSCAREYHAGMAAMAGIQAALAARAGFQGDPAILEAPRGFLHAMGGQAIGDIVRGLGDSWDIVTDMAIKLMPGAHPFHAVAEAAATAARQHDVDPARIARIVVSAGVQHTSFGGAPHPRNLVEAAHSVAYFVAASVVDRGFGWDNLHPDKMRDPRIAALQDKVRYASEPPPLPDRFPHRHGGSVAIHMDDGRIHEASCRAPRGAGSRGIAWADVQAKYRELAPRAGLDAGQVADTWSLIRDLDHLDDVAQLARGLMLR
ncbi:MmgE/PrpD family protein [Bordetella sp. H567]|uniref:MmgE/PrpD family protein n=1 Tax=Bordetella sp. H567 TaxID=1697043 RepID=UPI0008347AFF|nr:MmgE/PrpD family protein [Bordetella sp. H567]